MVNRYYRRRANIGDTCRSIFWTWVAGIVLYLLAYGLAPKFFFYGLEFRVFVMLAIVLVLGLLAPIGWLVDYGLHRHHYKHRSHCR